MSTDALIDYCVNIATGQETRRTWTEEDHKFLQEHVRVMTPKQLAQALGRTESAIHIRLVRKEMYRMSKFPGYYTGQQTARILGQDIHAIMMYQKMGILKFHVLPGPRHILQISKNALWAWAINPEHWIYFNPSHVRDIRLRRLIELKRARWPDEWWTTEQVREYWGLASTNCVAASIERGTLPAVRWGNWHVKRSDAMARHFIPGKGFHGDHHWSARADAFILRARAQGLIFSAIARMMKLPENTVSYRYHQLIKAGAREAR